MLSKRMPARVMPALASTCASYLRWWPTLAVRGVLEQRLQRRQHLLRDRAARGTGVVVRERHVGRHARLDAEGDADDLGAHVVEAGGLGVEREQRRGTQPREPALELLPVADHRRSGVRWRGRGHRPAAPRHQPPRRRLELARHSRRARWPRCRLRRGRPRPAFRRLRAAAAARAARSLPYSSRNAAVSGCPRRQLLERQRQLQVGVDRRQAPRQLERRESLAQVLAHLARHFRDAADELVEAAVLLQQLRGGLRSHLVDAGNVVASCRRRARGSR